MAQMSISSESYLTAFIRAINGRGKSSVIEQYELTSKEEIAKRLQNQTNPYNGFWEGYLLLDYVEHNQDILGGSAGIRKLEEKSGVYDKKSYRSRLTAKNSIPEDQVRSYVNLIFDKIISSKENYKPIDCIYDLFKFCSEQGGDDGTVISCFFRLEDKDEGKDPAAEAIKRLNQALRDIKREMEGEPAEPLPCPYKGLSSFTVADSKFFFGRDEDIDNIRRKIEKRPFVAVLGSSGSGKSSVVHGGVIPSFPKPPQSSEPEAKSGWSCITFKPSLSSQNPFLALAEVLYRDIPSERFQDGDDKKAVIEDKLKNASGATASKWLVDYLEDIQKHKNSSYLLLVIDQFEELFTPDYQDDRNAFIELLRVTADKQSDTLRIVITMRSDYLPRAEAECIDFYHLITNEANHYFVTVINGKDRFRDIITEPAKQNGVEFQEEAVDAILDDLLQGGSQANILPLLEYAMTEIWKHREGRVITLRAVEKVGDVLDFLPDKAEAFYQSDKHSDDDRKTILRIFLNLANFLEVDADNLYSKSTQRWDSQPDSPEAKREWELIQTLAGDKDGYRFLNITYDDSDQDKKHPYVEVVHDILLTTWTTLRKELDRNIPFFIWNKETKNNAKAWLENGKDQKYLLSGRSLAKAEDYLNPVRILDADIIEFINASCEADIQEKEAKEKRKRFYRRSAYLFFASLAICGIVIGILGFDRYKSAESVLQEANGKLVAKARYWFSQAREEANNNNATTAVKLALKVIDTRLDAINDVNCFTSSNIELSENEKNICRDKKEMDDLYASAIDILASQNGLGFISMKDIPLHGLEAAGHPEYEFLSIYEGEFYYDEKERILWTSGFKSEYKTLTAWDTETGRPIKTFPNIGEIDGFNYINDAGFLGVISKKVPQLFHIIKKDTLEVVSKLETKASVISGIYDVKQDKALILDKAKQYMYHYCTISTSECSEELYLLGGFPNFDQLNYNKFPLYIERDGYLSFFFTNSDYPVIPCGGECYLSHISDNQKFAVIFDGLEYRFGKIEKDKGVRDYFTTEYMMSNGEIGRFFHKKPGYIKVYFSPDGRFLNFTGARQFLIYSTLTGKLVADFTDPDDFPIKYRSAYFSKDSSLMALSKNDHPGVDILDTLSGTVISYLDINKKFIYRNKNQSDSILYFDKYEYTGLSTGSGVFFNKAKRASFPVGTHRSIDKEISFFNIPYYRKNLYDLNNTMSLLAYRSKGSIIKVIDLNTMQFKPFYYGLNREIFQLAISPSGEYLTVIDRSRTVYVWDISTGLLIYEKSYKNFKSLDYASVNNGRLHIVVNDENDTSGLYKSTVIHVDLTTKEEEIANYDARSIENSSSLNYYSRLAKDIGYENFITDQDVVSRNYPTKDFEGNLTWAVKAGVIVSSSLFQYNSKEDFYVSINFSDGSHKKIQLLGPHSNSYEHGVNQEQTYLVFSYREEVDGKNRVFSHIYSLETGDLLSIIDKPINNISESGKYSYYLNKDSGTVDVYSSKNGDLLYSYTSENKRKLIGAYVYDAGFILLFYSGGSYAVMPLALFNDEELINYFKSMPIRDFTEKERERLFLD